MPTIKSRCWIISFHPLEHKFIKEFLLKKFSSSVNPEIIEKTSSKFNGENLFDLIDELIEISQNYDGQSETLELDNEINFIEIFRYIYSSNFHKALTYLDGFNVFNNRQEASNFINQMLRFCYLVLKTKLSEEEKASDLIKLSNVIDESKFGKVIEFLVNAQTYIENYVNLNLIFIRIFFLIKNSFIKN